MKLSFSDSSGIHVYDEALSGAYCRDARDAIEHADDLIASETSAGVAPDRRQGSMLILDAKHRDLRSAYFRFIQPLIADYTQRCRGFAAVMKHNSSFREPMFSTPRLERIDPGQGFGWHIDAGDGVLYRCLAVVGYLNSVELGGGTEFLSQEKTVSPVEGRVVLFPPYWTHVHRGQPPVSGPKFTIACFGKFLQRPAAGTNAGSSVISGSEQGDG